MGFPKTWGAWRIDQKPAPRMVTLALKVYYSPARPQQSRARLASKQRHLQEMKLSYLIDGHNLIPRVPGLDLSDPDDEMQLIERLQQFCLHKRKKVTVFFDQAPPGMSGSRVFGQVRVEFVRQGQTADQAIVSRLEKLGRRAIQYTVVSSDQWVAQNARSLRSQVLSAEQFARQLQELPQQDGAAAETSKPEASSDPAEVQKWLDLFQKGIDEP